MTSGSSRVKLVIIVVLFLLVCACLPVNAADAGYRFVTKWGSLGSGDGQFSRPIGIAVDSSGNVLVADYLNSRIQKFTPQGVFITKWGSQGSGDGQFNWSGGVAGDSLGNVYVCDTNGDRIQKFTSDGKFVTKWGSTGSGPGQFHGPEGIAVDNSGNVYVVDLNNNRIQKFTSDGIFLSTWGSEGTNDNQFVTPNGIDVDPVGNVYVVEWNGGHGNVVKKFTSSGVFVKKWGSQGTGDGQFNGFGGIAVDSTGNVYITDFGNARVQKFSSDGTFLGKWGSYGAGDGQFYAPTGIAVDTSGNVYVTDDSNNRIQKFAPVIPTTLIPATLIVISNPTGADVFIDAMQRGTTPATFTDITPGTHSVAVSKIGYLGSYSTITVSPQQPSTVDVTLEPLKVGTGIISVRSDPPGASIILDGQYTMKTTPYDFYEVTPGVHTLEVTMLEYGTYTKTITVDPGTTVVVTTPWSYTEKDSVVFFSSDPDGANVYIDDSMKGVTPLSLHLKKGTYIVKMTKEGYEDDESALYVSSADPIQVTKTLETPGFGSILALVSLVAVVLLVRKYRG
jgi:streptogramin lyase